MTMIKSLRLVNWKSYKDSILYIDPLTIIIGTNSSGKSNALDALVFLSRIASGLEVYQSIKGDQNISPIRGGVDWVCRQGTNQFKIETEIEYDGLDYTYSITVEVDKAKALITEEKLMQNTLRMFYTNMRDANMLNIPTYFATGNQGRGQKIDLSRNTAVLYQAKNLQLRKKETIGIVIRILEELSGIFVLNPIPNHMRDYSTLSDKLLPDASNIAGVLAAMDEAQQKKIEGKLTSYLKDIPEKDIKEIWVESVGKFNTDAMLYCKESWGDNEESIVDARGMSDGTLRFLAIVVTMLTTKMNKLVVIEEVDNGLHPSRSQILLEMLKDLGAERNIDVIITTHNPALLNEAGTTMIPFITAAHRTHAGESELTLLEDIDELPKLIASGNIGDLTSNGKIESALAKEG